MSQDTGKTGTVTAQRLIRALDDATAKLQAVRRAGSEPIAVIGLGCRFPGGVESPGEFWQRLADGFDATCETPPDRWDVESLYDADPDAAGKIYTRRGGFLPRVDGFDARFFEISPREAASMDPQQRLMLEVTWETLEHAGLPADRLSGSRTGVYAGITTNDYGGLMARAGGQIDAWFSTGNALNALAGRVAHTLGLQGPSMAIDTACSSSLVAVHLACQSLRAGECDLALAGGVNLILAPEVMIAVCRSKMLAADGRCKTFDAAADGYARGEGCGVVALRRLSDALRQGENILAVIRGTAVNQDGLSSGFTVPNGKAQEALIRQALAASGAEPQEVDYLEAHGTGTALGDPIEVRAAANALGSNRTSECPLILGSVKTNIGHLESAAGVAGLIKVVLSVQQGLIPPHLHFHRPNPHVPWHELPVTVNSQLLPWPARNHPRRAGISSFGASGTNAHVIVEQFVPPPREEREIPRITLGGKATVRRPDTTVDATDRPRHALALSAKTPAALRELARRHGRVLTGNSPPPLADFCFSVNTGRAAFAQRLFLSATSPAEAGNLLAAFAENNSPRAVHSAEVSDEIPGVVLSFSGHDVPHREFARGLLETQPEFRSAWEDCQLHLGDVLASPLADALSDDDLLQKPPYAECAVFAAQYALARMWLSWGVRPRAVWGHGTGECTAACVAGVFRLDDALRLTVQRAMWMRRFPEGGESFRAPLRRLLERVPLQQPAITIICPATGQPATPQIATPAYWIRDNGKPVEFTEAIRFDGASRSTIVLEMGPATTGWEKNYDASGAGRDHWPDLLSSLGALYVKGVQIDWEGFDRGYQRRRVAAPTYPWQRKRFWHPAAGGDPAAGGIPAAVSQTPTLRHLQCGSTAALAKRLQETAAFTDAEKRLVPKLLEAIAWQLQLDEAAALTGSWLYEVRWRSQARGGRQPTPRFLPPPQSVCARLSDAAAPLTRDARFEEFWKVLMEAERLSAAYITEALQRLGWRAPPHSPFSTADMLRQLEVEPRHGRLLQRLLEILSEAGTLTRIDGQQWKIPTTVAAKPCLDLETSIRSLRERCPEADAELTMLHRCGAHLDQVLRGKCDPLALLFPGDDATASRLYEKSPGARVMNMLVAIAVKMAVDRLPPNRKLRVLEIGAGTGGATSYVLPRLPTDRTHYVFTDVSARFTGAARNKFRDFPFVRYATLNIERSPQSQGFAADEFDLVIAANVMHATRDLRMSVGHARSLLAPQGLLVLLEGIRPVWLVDLIFGLTEGWWRFADYDLRPEHPLLSAGGWQALLMECDFATASVVTNDRDNQGILAKQSVIIAQATGPTETQESLAGDWLILADRRGIGSELRDLIEGCGGCCTVAFAGQTVGTQRSGNHVVDPHGAGALESIVAAAVADAAARSSELLRVVHLWSLDAPKNSPFGEPLSGDEVNYGWGSALSLVQALVNRDQVRPVQLWLVTQDACPVRRSDKVTGLAASPLWGMARVIASEHPELIPRRVDLDGTSDVAQQAQQLLDEIRSDDTEDEIAYRDGERFVARLGRVVCEPNEPSRRAALRGDGTYLITGGLGGLGLLTARWMVERGARHIVLVGRRAPNAEAKSQVDELERLGASVSVLQADVSRRGELEHVLREIEARLPPLRGVIHAAGVLDDGVLRQLTPQRFARVLEPKAAGAWQMHDLTRNLPLDLFVLFSSATSLLGSPGQANHAAANAYLDALACHRRAAGLPAMSIDWGAWSEVGAAADQAIGDRVRTKGIGTIAPSQGLIVLERLLTCDFPQVAVIPIDWTRQAEFRPLFADLMPAAQQPVIQRPEVSVLLGQLARSSSRRRRSLLRDLARAEVAQVLGLVTDQVGQREGFMELGMDSLTSMELRNRLQKCLGFSLPATVAFDYPTSESLADFLERQFAARNSMADEVGDEPGAPQADADAPSTDGERDDDLVAAAESPDFNELSEAELGELIEVELRAANES